jgi:xanthine/uracil/vitamin C permease (AzgA family)
MTTFLTMAYIIVVQPAVLSGKMFGTDTGLEFGAVMTATCICRGKDAEVLSQMAAAMICPSRTRHAALS